MIKDALNSVEQCTNKSMIMRWSVLLVYLTEVKESPTIRPSNPALT